MSYTIAMIGAGYMARKHCTVLAAQEQAKLVAICSTAQRRAVAEEFCQQFGFARAVTDAAAIFADPDIDIVYICTPDHTHPELVVKALQAGKHVFCEKPLARTEAEFQQIQEQLQRSGKVLQVGMNCRFREQYALPKQMIATGTLGDLRFVRGTYIVNAVRGVRQGEKAWSLIYPPDVFPFLHGGGIHCLDLLRWIGGEIRTVFGRARGFELAEAYGADTFSISLEFASGALGELLVAGSAFRPNDFSLELWLSDGSIVGTTIFRRAEDSVAPEAEKITVEQKIIDLGLQYQDLIQAIETGSSPLNSFGEAYQNFRVLKAIEQSIRRNEPVPVAR